MRFITSKITDLIIRTATSCYSEQYYFMHKYTILFRALYLKLQFSNISQILLLYVIRMVIY